MFRELSNNKIGNILVYFSQKIPYLSLTKSLKLLYLIDEYSVRETGVPVTWLKYNAWKLGPVPEEIYNEIKYQEKIHIYGREVSLDGYVLIERHNNPSTGNETIFIKARKDFDDSEFSEYELELLEKVVKQYGKFSAERLVDLLHQEGTLWHKIVQEENLQRQFELYNGKSEHVIELPSLIDSNIKKMAFNAAFEAMEFEKSLSARHSA